MSIMGAFLIIILIIALLWPYIMRWLRGYLMRRAEDQFRKMAGQPTRKQEEKMRREQQYRQTRKRGTRHGTGAHPARELSKVAEDVQFTEIQEFTDTSVIQDDGTTRREYHEEQVEDVKFTEIKTDKK